MNIFVLDSNIKKCAQFHCDQHVVKMILESVQILCTVLNKKGYSTPYKSTHMKHPCVLWVEESYDNFLWLSQLATALNDEYKYRYEKNINHKSMQALAKIKHIEYESKGLTEFAQAMPDQYKVANDAVTAYRSFYLGEKMNFAKWSHCELPYWVKEKSNNSDTNSYN